jgi:hypothetical protein
MVNEPPFSMRHSVFQSAKNLHILPPNSGTSAVYLGNVGLTYGGSQGAVLAP